MVVLFCKKLPQLWEIFLVIREMNEPVMAIRGKAFPKAPWTISGKWRYINVYLFLFIYLFIYLFI